MSSVSSVVKTQNHITTEDTEDTEELARQKKARPKPCPLSIPTLHERDARAYIDITSL